MVFSPDGRTLATGGLSHSIDLWNVADTDHPSGRVVSALSPGAVYALDFNQDGTRLVSTGLESEAHVWNVADPGKMEEAYWPVKLNVATINEATYPRRPVSAQFRPHGTWFVTGLDDGMVALWNSDPQFAADRACALTTESDLPTKWRSHLPWIPYKPPCDWH
ncbi:WD40 repeat domain-containing protein [Kibdelosporangium lantanae]|uniref:WD40 repeat domain-containing protein n=1 Tax=Kibdelosporangium lantanae TaxID=1497396 RepID=A0ABW3MID6_9PSEU